MVGESKWKFKKLEVGDGDVSCFIVIMCLLNIVLNFRGLRGYL